jgi:hypothetical protein
MCPATCAVTRSEGEPRRRRPLLRPRPTPCRQRRLPRLLQPEAMRPLVRRRSREVATTPSLSLHGLRWRRRARPAAGTAHRLLRLEWRRLEWRRLEWRRCPFLAADTVHRLLRLEWRLPAWRLPAWRLPAWRRLRLRWFRVRGPILRFPRRLPPLHRGDFPALQSEWRVLLPPWFRPACLSSDLGEHRCHLHLPRSGCRPDLRRVSVAHPPAWHLPVWHPPAWHRRLGWPRLRLSPLRPRLVWAAGAPRLHPAPRQGFSWAFW